MAQATQISAKQALKNSIAHIGTIGGVSVSFAEEQRRQSHVATAFCFDDMLHRQYGGTMINYSKFTAFRGKKDPPAVVA